MPFINPIELLGLQQFDIVWINDDSIKKSRKKLLTEIELSDDGTHNYMGIRLTKSDCELAIEELNNKDKKEYYYQLANGLKPLNDYLVTGSDRFFSQFKQESIYRLPEFINFINPSFAENFSRSLLRAFKGYDATLISAILRTQILFDINNATIAYKGVSVEIEERIKIIKGIKEEFESEESNYTGITVNGTLGIVKQEFPINILNLLPPYFQSQINKIADNINFLGKAILEKFNNTQIPYDLLVYLLQLKIESVDRPVFEKNLQIIKERNEERIEQEKNAPVLKKWADILLIIKNNTIDVEGNRLNAKMSATNLEKAVNIDELNGLPSWANEIRDGIGVALRGVCVASWNGQKDLDTALRIINLALRINTSHSIKDKLLNDLKDLQELKKKQMPAYLPSYNPPYVRTRARPKSKVKGWLAVIFLIVFYGIAIIIGDISSPDSPASNNSYSSNPGNMATTSDSSLSDSNNNPAYSSADSTSSGTSDYVPVNMENGNISNRGEVHPEYDYKIDNKLVISAESTDAAVKIINTETDRCIRFVFINNGTTYIVRNIPEGKYYLEIEYGENWEVKEGEPNAKGHFANNDLFKTDRSDFDFNKVYSEDGEVSVPNYELTLYTSYSPNNLNDPTQPDTNSNDNY
jgi:hypothetical protein